MIKKIVEVYNKLMKTPSEDTLECSVDDEKVNCKEFEEPVFTGTPAPVYLKDDEWFGPAPEYTDKQKDYMERETEIKRQEFEKSFSVESEDIHQKMYELATSSSSTTIQLNPPGGSENFHEGPGGWNSGTGIGKF